MEPIPSCHGKAAQPAALEVVLSGPRCNKFISRLFNLLVFFYRLKYICQQNTPKLYLLFLLWAYHPKTCTKSTSKICQVFRFGLHPYKLATLRATIGLIITSCYRVRLTHKNIPYATKRRIFDILLLGLFVNGFPLPIFQGMKLRVSINPLLRNNASEAIRLMCDATIAKTWPADQVSSYVFCSDLLGEPVWLLKGVCCNNCCAAIMRGSHTFSNTIFHTFQFLSNTNWKKINTSTYVHFSKIVLVKLMSILHFHDHNHTRQLLRHVPQVLNQKQSLLLTNLK